MARPNRRTDSCRDRVSQSIFVTQSNNLNEQENLFLRAAASGNIEAVKHYVENEFVNANCQDYLGRGALELSVLGENLRVIEYLLTRCNLFRMEDALLGAINRDSVKICEMILNHPSYRTNHILLGNMGRFYHEDTINSPRFAPETTPIHLACHRNNYHIIQLLLLRGATIEEPHDYFCACALCVSQRVYDIVRYSHARLNTFKALASPAYISLSSEDPIATAFELSHRLDHLTGIEKEYKVRNEPIRFQIPDS